MSLRHCTSLLALVVLPQVCAAIGTDVSGPIATDTHWTVAEGPYFVTSDAYVQDGATLTIDPGVEVKFSAHVNLHVANGTLDARGTAGSPILFTSRYANPVLDQYWAGIEFHDGAADAQYDGAGNYVSGSVIEHAVLRYSGANRDTAILCAQSHALLSHVTIDRSKSGGVGVTQADGLRMRNVSILDSGAAANAAGATAVKISQTHGAWIDDCRFEGSVGNGLYLDNSSDIVVAGTQLVRNGEDGVDVRGAASGGILLSADPSRPTWIYGNGLYDVYNFMSFDGPTLADDGNVDARNVWWGSLSPATIAQNVYDYSDAANKGIVFHDPAILYLAGDANTNGTVDLADLAVLATNWNAAGLWPEGDFTDDGTVDLADLAALATNWNAFFDPTATVAGTPVPEPATLALLAAGVATLVRRRGSR